MKKYWFNELISIVLVLVIALAGFATSCAPKTEATEQIGVVVSILPQVDFVQSVGGEKVAVAVMVPPGASPHTYAPTPGQLTAVKQAQMYAKVGSGVEFELVHMDKIIEANKDMLVVDCSQGVELMSKDPHIWLSPRNAKIMVENICDGLIKVDPENEEYYTQNKNEYLTKLDGLDGDCESSLAGITNRSFMVFHPAWGYFARDYDLTQIPIEKEGKKPTAAGVAALIEQAKANNIKVVFVSPQFDVSSAKAIAEAIDGKVAFLNPLARDYINNMHMALGELVQGME
jgi:ABC-type metal ion transport system, periplasmic component/surface adhesin